MKKPARAVATIGAFFLASQLVAATGVETAGLGHLLLNGGGGESDSYWQKFLELAGGPAAPIVILPTASERPEAGEEYETELREKWKATNVRWLELRTRDDASKPEFVAAIAAARAVFFTGGDQSRITAALLGAPAFDAVRGVFERGGVLGGSSAGLACMSAVMITGEGDFTVLRARAVETKPGLGFVTGAILDQHFVSRQRLNRLLSVALENRLPGLGVDEQTAIWIQPDGTIEVSGERSVVLVDPRRAAVRTVDEELPRFGARGVEVDIYLPGDRFRLDGEPVEPVSLTGAAGTAGAARRPVEQAPG
jgi:cyanophycinase